MVNYSSIKSFCKLSGVKSILQTKAPDLKSVNFGELKPLISKTDHFTKSVENLCDSPLLAEINSKIANYAPLSKHKEIAQRLNHFVENKTDLDTIESLYTAAQKHFSAQGEKVALMRFNEVFKNINTLKHNYPQDYELMVKGGFFDFVKEGKISINNFRTDLSNARISPALAEDLRKAANKEEIVKDLTLLTKEQVQNTVKNGEVFLQNGKLFTKNNGMILNIDMTKEKYLELFPPVLRYASNQGRIGNCWLVSRLNNLISSESGASGLYSLFRQKGNDIYFKFPNHPKEILFPNSKPLVSPNGKTMNTVSGIAMAEQALAVHLGSKYAKGPVTDITKFSKNIDGLMNNTAADRFYYNLKRVLTGTHFIEPLDLISKEYTGFISSNRSGNAFTVHSFIDRILGAGVKLSTKGKQKNIQAMKDIIENQANMPNLKLQISFKKTTPERFKELYNMIPDHQLKLERVEDGYAWISNPWFDWIQKKVEVPALIEYLEDMAVPFKWS